ncbi:uncharacterized protein LOC134260609 [Saccostrea cucullata]|uniref:uncharacterized protein LOC134260609 n=1 Tax=Saccostrea cuccullata TaxID=36930 RepID=UPI002ED4F211
MLNRSKPLCQYFNTKSGCKFKENCKFLHPSPTSISSPSLSDNQENGAPVNEQLEADLLSTAVSQLSVSNQNHEAVNKEKDTTQKLCFNFEKHGNCRYGNKCRFLHALPKKTHNKAQKSDRTLKSDGNDSRKRNGNQQTQERKRTCHYYQAGHCQKGNDCRFYHSDEVGKGDISDAILAEDKKQVKKEKDGCNEAVSAGHTNGRKGPKKVPLAAGQRKVVPRPVQPVKEFKRDSLSENEVEQLRLTEIEQLKKRLASSNVEVITDSKDNFCVQFDFSSSDPDWPYDVEVFTLQVTIPNEYPLEMFVVRLPDEQNLPETVRRYIEASLEDWVNTKQAELISAGVVRLEFRPFLKWLDRSLESIVTGALKQLKKELEARAAGLQFIPASKLQEKVKSAGSDEDQEENEEEEEEGEDESMMFKGVAYRKTDEDLVYTGPQQDVESSEEEEEDLIESAITTDNKPEKDERRGTEIKLRNLTLKDNASTLTCSNIKIIIQCARCKNKMDVNTPSGRPNLVTCLKCSYPQVLTFRSAIMHQFSSVVGYLDLDGCLPFDVILQDCVFKLGCFSCNKEMKAKSMAFGQVTETWCSTCHGKMKVSAESVKFAQLLPSEPETDEKSLHKVPVLKPKKNLKEPEIQLGRPLPEDGTCKHYKKSFRWFRFPCCGKCYPCDICHEMKEGDHEMLLATRMICGHCCKEQPFALDKACVACKKSMTQVRTAFWEGGKGCRDKSKMSRNDVQKYSGQSKTVSRKAQEKLKSSTAKKNTKLRHSSN